MHGCVTCVQNFIREARREESNGRPRRTWENNISIDLMELDWEGVDWIHLAPDIDYNGLL